MTKNTITIVAIILLVAALAVAGCAIAHSVNKVNAFTRIDDGIIIEVNDNVVVVETTDGNLWEFEGEGYEVGTEVRVLFSNNGSVDCVKDDMVQKVWEA